MKLVGLLGGSFNPAHGGHRRISLFAKRALGLDEVWWLVSPANPLKPVTGMAPLSARVKAAQRRARARIVGQPMDMANGADRAACDEIVHGLVRRLVPELEIEEMEDACRFGPGQHLVRFGRRSAERLVAQDIAAVVDRQPDMPGVQEGG